MLLAGNLGHISNSQTGTEEAGEAVMECDHFLSFFYCFLGRRRSGISQACHKGFLNASVLVKSKAAVQITDRFSVESL